MKKCGLCGITDDKEKLLFKCDILQGYLCEKCCRLDVHGELTRGKKLLEEKNLSPSVARLLCQKCQDANEWLEKMHEG